MNRLLLFFVIVFFYCSVQGQFINPLAIPDTMSGVTFNLNVSQDTTQFMPGINTQTMGYNGSYLGPTLIFQKDDSVQINITNNLGEETTVHWHGYHVPAIYDGGPHNTIASGATWSPKFRVYEDASTMWYHSHLHNNTKNQVSKGLAGLIINRDAEEAAITLPRKYGIDDFPIILQDKTFDGTGQIDVNAVLGDTFLINGTLSPYLDCPAQVVRFRLLNGSVRRAYYVGFNDNRNFHLLATDGGLLENTSSVNRVIISPGERVEILVDFSGQETNEYFLVNYASELHSGVSGGPNGGPVGGVGFPSVLNGVDRNMLKLQITGQTAGAVTTIPNTLRTITKWNEADAVKTRRKEMSGILVPGQPIRWTINDDAFNIGKINDTIFDGDIEVWEIYNGSAISHPFHIHAGHFFVLDRDSVPVSLLEEGKKDVVLVNPNETVRFIMKFEDFPDPDNTYMYHCHLLDHEDAGMMAQFIMVDSSFFSSIDIVNDNKASVFPNPATDMVQVSLEDITIDKITVLNSTGKVIKEITGIENTQHQIHIQNFTSGVYIIAVESEGKTRIKKIVKK